MTLKLALPSSSFSRPYKPRVSGKTTHCAGCGISQPHCCPPFPPQAQDSQRTVVAQAAAPHEDLAQVQGQLRRVGLRPARARAALERLTRSCLHVPTTWTHHGPSVFVTLIYQHLMKVLLTLIPNQQAPVTTHVPHQLQCMLSVDCVSCFQMCVLNVCLQL